MRKRNLTTRYTFTRFYCALQTISITHISQIRIQSICKQSKYYKRNTEFEFTFLVAIVRYVQIQSEVRQFLFLSCWISNRHLFAHLGDRRKLHNNRIPLFDHATQNTQSLLSLLPDFPSPPQICVRHNLPDAFGKRDYLPHAFEYRYPNGNHQEIQHNI